MKKITTFILISVLLFTYTGCGSVQTEVPVDSPNMISHTAEPQLQPTASPEPVRKPQPTADNTTEYNQHGTAREMYNSAFWIAQLQNADEVILNSDEIQAYNETNRKNPATLQYDLKEYPESLTKQELTALLTEYTIPAADRYIDGKKADSAYYNGLLEARNLQGVKEHNPVRYGFAMKDGDLRTFPTEDAALKSPGDIHIDRFQETVVHVWDAVLVLHSDLSGHWYYVQTGDYRGWVRQDTVAVAEDKSKWLEYVEWDRFLVVTANQITLGVNPYTPEVSEAVLFMGTKLPLMEQTPETIDGQSTAGGFAVKLPMRDAEGYFMAKDAIVPYYQDTSEGYLPYTKANVLKQAYKMLGDRYGWGGMYRSRDCSGFVQDLYKVFGIYLPRNVKEQEQIGGKSTNLKRQSFAERLEIIKSAMPGSLLTMDGHIMLYLGTWEDRPYIMHATSQIGVKDETGTIRKHSMNAVTVTPLDIYTSGGTSYIDSLNYLKEIRD